MKLTPKHADAITRLLLTIRPDWSQHYTHDAVSRMRHIDDDLERITGAAIRGALSARIVKPDVLAMNGAHWRPAAVSAADATARRLDITGRCACGVLHPDALPCPAPAAADVKAHADRIRALLHHRTQSTATNSAAWSTPRRNPDG